MGVIHERKRLRRSCPTLTRAHKIVLGIFGALFVFYYLSPYDSRTRSALRFQHTIAQDYLQEKFPTDGWLFKTPRFPVDADKEIGVIVKTGYGTKNRVSSALEALSNQTFFSDTVVVQDFPIFEGQEQHYNLTNGKSVPTIDIIGWNLERGALNGTTHLERIHKYKHLAEAVEAEEWVLSDGLGKQMGWELDAMKFLPALEYVWRNIPKKKWYLMLDDDSYVIKSSLLMLLSHLDPRKPSFIGNPIGDYKGRFPHGGSSVILSGSALSKLFDGHPEVAAAGNYESPKAIWGDKLLATTLMKIGVYLDEGYRRMFNGENPWMTRMWADRFCMPLVSFHGLGQGDAMQLVGNTFKDMRQPVFWRQLGGIYGAADFKSFHKDPVRVNMDFVGRLDEHSMSFATVPSVQECIRMCGQHSSKCLAWSYDPAAQLCHIAPWAIIGDFIEGRLSGINAPLAEHLESGCHKVTAATAGLQSGTQNTA